MKRLSTFVAVSLIVHLVIVLGLVDVRFSSRTVDISDVYEVSIVTEVPSSGAKSAPSQSPQAPQGKKYFYQKGADLTSIGEIKKERALKEHAPELTPSDIKPVQQEREELNSGQGGPGEDLPSSVAAAQGGTVASGSGSVTGAADEITLWKAQVRSLVDRVWKTPPEISIMDMSLKTTYLLNVSRGGDLLQMRLLISSGNSPFDRSVLLALNSVTRFPPPPLVLIAGQNSVEVTMSFTPPKGAE
ncbi:MAG: TonB family protein [Desulfomonilia bacterium]